MRRFGIITVVLLVGLVCWLGMPPAAEAVKKPASAKTPAVEKSSAKSGEVLSQWWRDKKKKDMLGLTQEQVQKLEEVLKNSAVKRRGLNQRVKYAQEEFNRIMSKGELDADKLKALAEEMGDARAELIRNRVEASISIHGIFTPAQLEKIRKKDAKAFDFERSLAGGKAFSAPKKSAQKSE